MKVWELIELLGKYPPEEEVYRLDDLYGVGKPIEDVEFSNGSALII